MTLYDLTDEYMRLLELAEDSDIEDEIIIDTMDALTGEIECKFEGYGKILSQMNNDISSLKEEEKRISERRKSIENRVSKIKEHLMHSMNAMGTHKIKTTLFSFNIQRNPVSVMVDVPWTKLPEDYLKYKDPEIDKKRILADLKAGKDLEGIAHIVQTESLRIR